MKTVIKQPDIDLNNNVLLIEKSLTDIRVSDVCLMSVDGSTTNTGVAILREQDGALVFTASFSREKEETPVQYKVRLKKAIENILINNNLITRVFYEEPIIRFSATATQNLMMLRTFVEEIIIENEPTLDYIKHVEIPNTRWKKLFLSPDKVPATSELQKQAVRKKLESYIPYLSVVTQDEIDAISMGFIAAVQINKGVETELASKKKARPFKYNILFIGADNDDDMLLELPFTYDGPQYLFENGIVFSKCKSSEDFNKHIYKEMGNDDKVLVIRFESNKHGNIVLQHKIGHLSNTYNYIYAVVWRKSRK